MATEEARLLPDRDGAAEAAEAAEAARRVRGGRWMAHRGEPFVVFLFGMRWNRLRGLPRFVWGLRVLRRVLAELKGGREPGFLAGHVYLAGRTLIATQYWESFDTLDAYARDHALPHRRAWQRYLGKALNDPAMGLWHETYLVELGGWEGVYVNMPPWGLGAGAGLREMRATTGSARDRLHQQLRGRVVPPGPPDSPDPPDLPDSPDAAAPPAPPAPPGPRV